MSDLQKNLRWLQRILVILILALVALIIVLGFQIANGNAATVRQYIGHPKRVARVETRRQIRAFNASVWGPGTGVSIFCTVTTRRVDDCQETINPPNAENAIWRDGTAYISKNGHHFHVVWS